MARDAGRRRPPDDISREIWETRYRSGGTGTSAERSIEDTWRRIAGALAAPERSDREGWQQRFYAALEGFRFLPGGRIQAGAGTRRRIHVRSAARLTRVKVRGAPHAHHCFSLFSDDGE
ncbi:MAG TPA: ribonucleotide reductase N-terminal alpha domain-containing protein [Casimicrobiaceae bacterium]